MNCHKTGGTSESQESHGMKIIIQPRHCHCNCMGVWTVVMSMSMSMRMSMSTAILIKFCVPCRRCLPQRIRGAQKDYEMRLPAGDGFLCRDIHTRLGRLNPEHVLKRIYCDVVGIILLCLAFCTLHIKYHAPRSGRFSVACNWMNA